VLIGPESIPALNGERPGSKNISHGKAFLGKYKNPVFKFPLTTLCFTFLLFATVVDKAI
jgi:hypothetical protein